MIVCPGSFDPITSGHLDVVRRAAALFGDVAVAVAHNPAKTYLFPIEQRVDLARRALAEEGILGVRVDPVEGLLVDYCEEIGARTIVKGLRGSSDFLGEETMARMNRHISGIETVFVLADPAFSHVASSYVKEIAIHGRDVRGLVADVVAEALAERLGGTL